jgi:DNA invertase Pin-like site-specific DNA recombinase
MSQVCHEDAELRDQTRPDLILQERLVQRLRDLGTPVRSASEPDLDTDTDDPTKVPIRQIIGAASQYERAVIRGRMTAGKAAKAAQGGFLGGRPPYGFMLESGEGGTGITDRTPGPLSP